MIAVAIDGPAGAGKSSIARKIARNLGFVYVDTGALYRAVGLYMLERGVMLGDAAAVTAALDGLCIALQFVQGRQRVLLCGEDVTDLIRTPRVSQAASMVSAVPAVRAFLLQLQKDFAQKNNVIMDGRDIGTVVLPQAQVKIFLTASPEARAKRRYTQLRQKGVYADFDTILTEILQRDDRDKNRAVAPLVPADDAVIVDSTGLTKQQVIRKIRTLIQPYLAQNLGRV